MTAWAEQNWKTPEFDFSERNDRVPLKLEVGQVVYIPGAVNLQMNIPVLTQEYSADKQTSRLNRS